VLQVEQAPELIVRRRSGEQSVSRDQVLTYAHTCPRAGPFIRPRLQRRRPALCPARGPLLPATSAHTLETERRRDELRRSVDPSKYIVRAGTASWARTKW